MVEKKGEKVDVDPQKRVIELLEELVKWNKFSSMPNVKKVLLDILPTEENKLAYQFSDGRKSEEISKIAGVDSSTIRDWGKIWINVGIAEPMPVKGGERAKRLFSLEDFGIDIPKPKQKIAPDKLAAQTTPATDETKEGEKI